MKLVVSSETIVQRLRHAVGGRPAGAQLLANCALLVCWVWLYRPVYPYLKTIFTRQEFRTNQIVLLAILALLAMQLRRDSWTFAPGDRPRLYGPVLALVLGGSGLFLVVERYLDVNTLSASLFGLASYGLLGLWMRPRRWRSGLPAALLLVGALPFGEHMQTFVGYPVRLATAAIVRDGLSMAGVHAVGVDTILVFENGISQVDLPCSGVQSLWTGGLFLLAATWIERRPLNLRWLVVAAVFALLLLAANLSRVAVLVTVGEVAGWRLIAEMLHVPLGVLGFAGACAAAAALLHTGGPAAQGRAAIAGERPVEALPRPGWLAPGLTALFLGLSVLYAPRPAGSRPVVDSGWSFPDGLTVERWPLTQGELDWLSGGGALAGDRWRFDWRGRTGSILLVTSDSWRAHHRPERCFEVYGLSIETARTTLAAPDFPVRWLSLGAGDGREAYTAAYWFQSAEQVTDDYATRIWDDLAPQRDRWVLATVLLDEPADLSDTTVQTLFPALRDVIANNLGEGAHP